MLKVAPKVIKYTTVKNRLAAYAIITLATLFGVSCESELNSAPASQTKPNLSTHPKPSHAVVLMYHHFGDARYPSTNIRLEQFDAQLNWLEQQRYQIWPLQKIVNKLINKQPIPDKTVAITVDDAYLSVYQHAYPRLKKRNWPFTVFVATDNVDKHLPAFMSWDSMREMQKNGVSFANHSASHNSLINKHSGETATQWQQRITNDIEYAAQRLDTELGTTENNKLLAYPYGEYNTALSQLVHSLGYTAFGQQSGALSVYSQLTALPRYPIAEAYGDIEGFALKVASLAMPVITVTPDNPVTSNVMPKMSISLDQNESDVDLTNLRCFASHQSEAMTIHWLKNQARTFTVTTNQALPTGRSRYNCTAPSTSQPERFYWFSQMWIYNGE